MPGEHQGVGVGEQQRCPAREFDRLGDSRADGQRVPGRVAQHQAGEFDGVGGPGLVLGAGHPQPVLVRGDQQPGAAFGERPVVEVEFDSTGGGGGHQRPPRPEEAMLLRILRCPIRKAISIGTTVIAESAAVSP